MKAEKKLGAGTSLSHKFPSSFRRLCFTRESPGDLLPKHYICQGDWRNQVKESHTWLFLKFFADIVFKNLAHEQHKMTKSYSLCNF
ncbi:hypothetical protein K1719_020721 [Acacia pycnantha]|nr:hypothetical protein K1719_020721 [Acacia pycnantha]